MPNLILIRGGGDLASGVALRLFRSGMHVVISELPQPLAVRRSVSFAEAVYAGKTEVEGVIARLVHRDQIPIALRAGEIPVIVDPTAAILTDPSFLVSGSELCIAVVVDARLTKQAPKSLPASVSLHIGLGPGFVAGLHCDAVIETRRSHTLSRVYWQGSTQTDSGQPEGDPRRVLRAPIAGRLEALAEIGDHVKLDQSIARISPEATSTREQRAEPASVLAPFPGVLRGLLHPGLHVRAGLKIGDVDPRNDPTACSLVSDKALAIGGGVLEAVLSRPEVRTRVWG